MREFLITSPPAYAETASVGRPAYAETASVGRHDYAETAFEGDTQIAMNLKINGVPELRCFLSK